jgi:transposase
MWLPPEIAELVEALKRELEALKFELEAARAESATARAESAAALAENRELRAENAELRRRLDLDSSNSSKPPSSDGLKKKPRVLASLRTRSGKPSGGQKGHRGDTLRQVADPDRIVPHTATACLHCSATLDPNSVIGEERRQVFDLPERLLEVTEHRATIHRCPHCRGQTRAAFPEGVVSPTQYGERFKGAAVYLNQQQLVPEDRVAQALQDLFGAALVCPASVAQWARRKTLELTDVYRAIGERAYAAKVRCLDETGLRIAGKLGWLHTTSTHAYTFYRAGEPRAAVPRDLKGGVVVHDHFGPYNKMQGVAHAFCNAHLLRELKAVIELDGEPWATAMRDMLTGANDAVRKAKEAGASALDPAAIKRFEECYWEAVRAGYAYHLGLPALAASRKGVGRQKKRPGYNLLIRFKQYSNETLRFLTDFDVPFTNNLAEQDLRMMKVKMKISGCFRTLEGALDFAQLRSVISSARKQGLNILQILSAPAARVRLALRI